MNLDTMRYFKELAETGTFYGAAKRLFMSQQGLNKAITALEDELGAKLIDRGRRGVSLTPDGERFLAFANQTVFAYEEFLGTLYDGKSQSARVDDPINIHVTYYSAQIASGSQEYVELLTGSAYLEEPFEKIVHRVLSSDGSDLSFVDLHANTMPKVLANPNLVFSPVVLTKIGVVCRSDSPLAKRDSLRRGEVAGRPCAVNAFKEMAQVLEWLFRETPLSDIRMSAASPRMLLRFAKTSSDGVALYDSFGFHLACQDETMPTDDLVFVPLSTQEAICHIGFLLPKHIKTKPRVAYARSQLMRFLHEKHGDYLEDQPSDRP